MPNLTWPINPPTDLTGANGTLVKISSDPIESTDLSLLDPQISDLHTKHWSPLDNGWRIPYGSGGLQGCQQSWIAPWEVEVSTANNTIYADLPTTCRQLLSWNRERFAYQNQFWDMLRYNNLTIYNTARPLVVTDIEVSPRLDLADANSENTALSIFNTSTIGMMAKSTKTWEGLDYSYDQYMEQVHDNLKVFDRNEIEIKSLQPMFPRVRSQYWQINVTFHPDPYVNRLGIRYAKVEISPSLRLESLKNVQIGIVPTNNIGQPDFASVDPSALSNGTLGFLDRATSGFPVREPQISIKVTYPWVSMTRLTTAGPIGNPKQVTANTTAVVDPRAIPEGLYIGCVNLLPFLGYPRGRVLYNTAELVEEVSPVTGYIGYKVTHEFLVNPNMEWNQTRYNKSGYTDSLNSNTTDANSTSQSPVTPWRTGFMVQLDASNGNDRVYRVNMATGNSTANYQAVYPYPYKDLGKLLYYGMANTTTPFNPNGQSNPEG